MTTPIKVTRPRLTHPQTPSSRPPLPEPEPEPAKSPTADRHLTQTQSLRVPGDLRAWFAERAEQTGQSAHALMLAALGDYRDAHSLPALGDYAAAPERPGTVPEQPEPAEQ